MNRTALTRKTPMKRGTAVLKRAPMKKAAKKPRRKQIGGDNDKAYSEACRGERCFLQVPGECLGAAGLPTVVPAHSNQIAHGKGMGIKALNKFTVPACMSCHSWLDQSGAPRELKFALFDAALALWEPVREEKLKGKP